MKFLLIRHLFIAGFLLSNSAYLVAQNDAAQQARAFQNWLQEFRTEALTKGISEETLDSVLPTIKSQRQAIISDTAQPEFKDTYARYLRRVSPWRIEYGVKFMQENEQMIDGTTRQYGVQPRFVTAILGIETNYGTVDLPHSVFNVLATLAFDGRRSAQFRANLFAAFEIVDRGYASIDQMKSSYAGALGIPQFSASSFLRLAVDQDNDGIRDIFNIGPDVIASVANYLKDSGWRDDQTWGRIVTLPVGGERNLPGNQSAGMTPDTACKRYRSLGVWRSLPQWQELGVRRIDGTDLPTRPLPAALVIGDEGDDMGYLVYRNFCSIMQYNPSFKYALVVGLLADEIAVGQR